MELSLGQGDSGYPLEPWLLTPIAQPENDNERLYNRSHKAIRNVIERTNGILKQRFRCLFKHRTLHYAPTRAAKIIYSCAILHNLCIIRNDNLEDYNDSTSNAAAMFLSDHVAEHLRCDLCRRYLSVPPITTHEDKTSCGRCDPGWHRNMAYERLAQFTIFPCTYCEKRLPWDEVPAHEEHCRQGVVLCCSSYERKYALSRMPATALGEYHKECQWRTVSCPFDYCDNKYQIGEVVPHFEKFHRGYIFPNNLVSARKILKEEKVWNFNSDDQVCLILFRQMPFLLFVHSDCNYNETTGDILSYEYHFGLFSFCKKQCDIKYTASITLESGMESSHFVMKNQEVKPFNDRLHLVKFIRIGLVKQNSFNFLTTRFQNLKRTDNLILTYTVKLQDNFKAAPGKYSREQLLKVGTLGKNFECPICNEYMCAPVYNCSLGHSVCKSCKSKMTVCPFCKAFIGNSRNFALEDILETLRVACQNEGKGCDFKGSIAEVQFHELKCAFNG